MAGQQPDLTDEFLAALWTGALKVPTVYSESVIFHIGSATNERAGDAGAVANRDSRYITSFASAWPPTPPWTRSWPGSAP